MMRFKHGIRSLVAISVACGCSQSTDDHFEMVEIVDSAGVTLVRSLYADFDTLAVQLIEESRIGVAEGAMEYQFHRILGLTVDVLGRTFVANGGTSTVRVYDVGGRWVRDIGRRGSGPGEFRGLSTPAIWRDSLGLFDTENLRFALFDTAGTFLDSWSMLLQDGRVIYPLRGGPAGWTIWIANLGRAREPRPAGTVVQDTVWLGHADLAALAAHTRRGTAVDSAILGTVPWPNTAAKWAFDDEEGLRDWAPLFGPSRRWALDDAGRIYLSSGYPYQIDIFDETGVHVRRVTRAFHQRLVTDTEVKEYLTRLAAGPPDAFSEQRQARERRHAEVYRADYFSATRGLLASRSGEIWVERPDAVFDIGNYESIPGFVPGPRYWDAFDATGRYEFTVRMPDRFTARWIDRRTVVGVLRDDNDVEYVVRYRVEEVSRAAASPR